MNDEGIPADDGMLSEEEFAQWLKDPANMQFFEERMKEALTGKFGPLDPVLQRAAEKVVRKRHEERAMLATGAELQQLMALLKQPPEGMAIEAVLKQCRQLVDEISDGMLDAPEPQRTELFKLLQPLRDRVQALG